MANAAVAWDQRPDYLAYTNWTPIPGVTSYVVPRRGTGTNVTQFHPGQAFLSEHNLPDIMYELHPPAEWKLFKDRPLPGPKRNPNGSLISTVEDWWYLEFVRRMDPRIRHLDIIMREEFTAERSRMSDTRYINLHLSTPGYRSYRPAWKMLAWQVTTGSAAQSARKQFVLDSLTDAQINANTTRGSTPGLIDPALGEVAGNRVPLPDLRLRKRGPNGVQRHANYIPATQRKNCQARQAPPTPPAPPALPAPPAYQIHQAPRTSQSPLNYLQQQSPGYSPPQISQGPLNYLQQQSPGYSPPQTSQGPLSYLQQQSPRYSPPQTSQGPLNYLQQQHPEYSQASSSNIATAPFPVASVTVDVPSQEFASVAAAQGQDDLRGYADINARDAAAMPPPPLPLKCRNILPRPHVAAAQEQNDLRGYADIKARDAAAMPPPPLPLKCRNILPRPNVSGPWPASPYSTNGLAEFLDTQADVVGAKNYNTTEHHVPESGYPFMSDEEIATMSANSAEAMTEILQTCEPFLGPCSNLQDPPPMDLSAELIKDLGMGSMFPCQNMAQRTTPMLLEKRGTKRKERDDGNHVQLDVESQGRRPIKRVRSAPDANFQFHNDPFADYQSGYSYGQVFGGPALQCPPVQEANSYTSAPYEEQYGGMGVQQWDQITEPNYIQQYSPALLETTFPDSLSSADSPYCSAALLETAFPDSLPSADSSYCSAALLETTFPDSLPSTDSPYCSAALLETTFPDSLPSADSPYLSAPAATFPLSNFWPGEFTHSETSGADSYLGLSLQPQFLCQEQILGIYKEPQVQHGEPRSSADAAA